jgi:AcrR family transcriptional regulator
MPRALTEEEKCRLCRRLMDRGREVVLAQGMRKVSVDDITRAAGMAKGSFYQHFESKDQFLSELMLDLLRQIFEKAEQVIMSGDDLKASFRSFLVSLVHMPEMAFLTRHHREIDELFENLSEKEMKTANQMELAMYERLLVAAGIDTERVRPGVVHNLVFALYATLSREMLIEEDLPKTLDLMMDNLIAYVFGGAT